MNFINCKRLLQSMCSSIGDTNNTLFQSTCQFEGFRRFKQVILAYKKPEITEEVIRRGLTRYTRATITEPDKFYSCLDTIRKNGYATSHGELREGVSSMAAPIQDYTRDVIGAITMVGPIQRFTPQKIQQISKQLLTVSKEISVRLGYYERRR